MTPKEKSQFQILRAIELEPNLTQRQLAKVLGVSNGKAHYLMVGLAQKGLVKFAYFKSHSGKFGKIAYLLTLEGIRLRMAQTEKYLTQKKVEFDSLKAEIDALKTLNKIEVTVPKSSANLENLEHLFSVKVE